MAGAGKVGLPAVARKADCITPGTLMWTRCTPLSRSSIALRSLPSAGVQSCCVGSLWLAPDACMALMAKSSPPLVAAMPVNVCHLQQAWAITGRQLLLQNALKAPCPAASGADPS